MSYIDTRLRDMIYVYTQMHTYAFCLSKRLLFWKLAVCARFRCRLSQSDCCKYCTWKYMAFQCQRDSYLQQVCGYFRFKDICSTRTVNKEHYVTWMCEHIVFLTTTHVQQWQLQRLYFSAYVSSCVTHVDLILIQSVCIIFCKSASHFRNI